MQENKKGSKFTFDSFEVTKSNSLAYEKAKQFAEDADSKPLALYGGTAAGKTHLLYAVKNSIEHNSPEVKVILTTTEDMISSLTSIISSGGKIEQFREQYMQADVLLVDDIHNLGGKERIQEEFILLFNAFYESGKRFMMTSSQKDAKFDLNDRLVIRGFWGEFAVISKSYIHAQFPNDKDRANRRDEIIEEGNRLVDNFELERFKTYYKNIWKYFIRYIGIFDIDRNDIRLINSLNDILNVLLYETPLEECECQTCILLTKGMLYTISTYDCLYTGDISRNGDLCIPLPHHAGCLDFASISIEIFDLWFNNACEEYRENGDFCF